MGEQKTDQKVMNRWLIVVGALLIQLCLGAIYSWGAFTGALQTKPVDALLKSSPELLGLKEGKQEAYASKKAEIKKEYGELKAVLKAARKERDAAKMKAAKKAVDDFRSEALSDEWIAATFDKAKFDKQVFNFSATQTSWIFSAGLAAFALVMILAGRWQDKAGPRIVAITGGAVLGAGYILAGLTGTSFPLMLILIGLVGGAGIGLGYVCPIACAVKWFPDLKGLIAGLAVAGFGAGAFIFVKLAGPWAGLIPNLGVNMTFIIFGAIFAITVIGGAMLLVNPPEGYKPAGWDPAKAAGGASKPKVVDLTQGEIVKTAKFWMMWLAFVGSAGCGLMVIKCLKNFGEFEGGLTVAAAGSALGLLSLFNGLGRVVWGTVSGKLGARLSLVVMCFLQAGMMFVLLGMGSNVWTLGVAACWIGFNFGGNFALFPLLTAESFGTKSLGANYGAVFTSYGVGGILGPYLAGAMWDTMGTYKIAFIIGGAACIAAAVLGMMIGKGKVAEAKAELKAAAKAEA